MAAGLKGFKELDRAFKKVDRDVERRILKGSRKDIVKIVEPVRALAAQLAQGSIANIGDEWFQMRIGVLTKAIYVAPKKKRTSGDPRPNLAGLLMDQAMQPALDDKQEHVFRGLEGLLDDIANGAGF